jgi:hypothetical protein
MSILDGRNFDGIVLKRGDMDVVAREDIHDSANRIEEPDFILLQPCIGTGPSKWA